MCLQILRNLLGMTEIGKPKNTQDITANDILQLIAEQLGYYPGIKMMDDKYRTTDYSEYDRFIHYDQTNLMIYEPEYWDCDDAAVSLYGSFTKNKYWSALAFGFVCAKNDKDEYHAFNLFITNNKEIWYCEPQSDHCWKAIDDNTYKPYFIMF